MTSPAVRFQTSANVANLSLDERKKLIRRIAEAGGVFVRHGGKHDWCRMRSTNFHQTNEEAENEILGQGYCGTAK